MALLKCILQKGTHFGFKESEKKDRKRVFFKAGDIVELSDAAFKTFGDKFKLLAEDAVTKNAIALAAKQLAENVAKELAAKAVAQNKLKLDAVADGASKVAAVAGVVAKVASKVGVKLGNPKV